MRYIATKTWIVFRVTRQGASHLFGLVFFNVKILLYPNERSINSFDPGRKTDYWKPKFWFQIAFAELMHDG